MNLLLECEVEPSLLACNSQCQGKKNPDLKEPLTSFLGKGNIACDNEHLIEIAGSVMLAWIGIGMKI